ncbi:hypothetical protein CTAYLR_003237 [Chrysophaeum taylorii]|uniref:Myosin motor domain-containing protein n=1 Tax=Chrysophaeum taylorii TaxID=2483200 RepID=A0AAD7XJ05_9STRA|nr:hypothetical protein CTAYLR_003237 [Chrysophaeum taylorii]
MVRGVRGIFEDQAGEFDWQRENVGAAVSAVYQQRRVYLLTVARRDRAEDDQGLVVAMNSRTGNIEWRRALPLGEVGDAIVLTPLALVTLSGGGRFARGWRLGDGGLLWDAVMPPGSSGENVGLVAVRAPSCVVVALGGDAVSAFDCETGATKAGWPWYPEPEDDARLGAALGSAAGLRVTNAVATPDSRLFACGLAERRGAWVVELDVGSGGESRAAAGLAAGAAVGAALVARSGRALPLLVVADRDGLVAYDAAAVLGGGEAPGPVASLDASSLVGEAIARIRVEPNSAGRVLRVLGAAKKKSRFVAAATAEEATTWGGVLVALGDEACGTASCASLGAFATPASAASGSGEAGARVFWAQVSPENRLDLAEIGGRVLAAGDEGGLDPLAHGPARLAFPHVFEKKKTATTTSNKTTTVPELAYRALVTTAAESVAMVAKDRVSWCRDEALASIVAADFVEAPVRQHLADADEEGPEVEPTLWQRLELQAESISATARALAKSFKELTDAAARKQRQKAATAELYGLDKLAIARTRAGRLFAIAAHTGEIAWSRLIPELVDRRATVVATRRASDAYHDPELTVVSTRDGRSEVTRLDAHTGATKDATVFDFETRAVVPAGVSDATGRDVLLVVGPGASRVAVVPESAAKAVAAEPKPFYVFLVDDGVLRTFELDKTTLLRAVPRGEVVIARPGVETLEDAATAPAAETVSAKSHILGDDAILLKYLNPHLCAVCTVSAGGPAPLLDPKLRTSQSPDVEPPSLYVTLVDAVASKVVARVAHPHGAAPCRVAVSENWVVYSYWNSKAKRNELGSLSLHEGMFDRYGLSPFKVPEQETSFFARSAPPPVALYRTFAIDKPVVSNLAPTLTSRGIASKQFLVGIAPGQILALDRRSLDPRRPILDDSDSKNFRSQRKKVERELDEGLYPYTPFIPLKPKAIITYSKTLLGLNHIWSTPTKLESTTLVLAAGVDVYGVPHKPSGGFDILADDFNYALLLLLLLGLFAGALILRAAANRKNLALHWTQAYIEATVKKVRENEVVAATADGREFTIDLEAPLRPPSRKQKEAPRRILQRVSLSSASGVENMDNLTALHEASILDNVQFRFRMDLIYTNTGPILIAMNPFKWLPIYGDDVISQYHTKPYGSMPPHCFQEAEDAFVQLQKYRKNQAIVICGESGAGKTETTKLMLHYLATVSKRTSERDAKRREKEKHYHHEGPTIAERMVNSNPLLEAYGNAKTLRNDNSSRFGKFTRFDFKIGSSLITGGFIENLLLEKVRVVEQGEGERNYHIFYQLAAAARKGHELATPLCSGDPTKYALTNKSGCVSIPGVDDAEEFEATVGALGALGSSRDEIDRVLRVTAAVYRLGDIAFDEDDEEYAVASAESKDALETAATWMGVEARKLGAALCCRVRHVGDERVVSKNEPHQARQLRDALAKATYSRLFDWLVYRANQAFDRSASGGAEAPPPFIGILDIYGFEIMKTNGFEQVFINTTNEQLQKVFNDIIFKSEAEEYQREQIDWDKTVFPDNTPCIELLTKRPAGILRMLDAECLRGNAASDGAKFARKLNKEHGHHVYFEVCGPASVWRRSDGGRTSDEDFLVRHFAAPVVYTVAHFIDKNRDALYDHVHDLLAASKTSIVADCFPKRLDDANDGGGSSSSNTTTSSSRQTVANRYLGQLSALVTLLRESSTRFVRCIKTNHAKVPAKLDTPSVLSQLVCSGVMAALEVRRAGFPTRIAYREFVREFRAFTPKKGPRGTDDKDLTALMLQHPHVQERVAPSAYRLGVSKLFLQAEVLYNLQSIKNAMLYPFVRRLQRWWVSLQGSILQRKFKRCAADLAETTSTSSIKGVHATRAVVVALETAEKIKAEAWAVVCVASATDAMDAISKLRSHVDRAARVVADAVARKEEAYRIRATLLAEIDAGNERCDALRLVASSLYDAKDAAVLGDAAGEAAKSLGAVRVELMTAVDEWEGSSLAVASKQGPLSLQRQGTRRLEHRDTPEKTPQQEEEEPLKAPPPPPDPPLLTPEEAATARRKKLDDALQLVHRAEVASLAMLDKKKLMDEARAEYQASLDLASENLATIQVDVFIIAGITRVSDAVAEARDAIFAAQKALQSIDPDPVKLAVENATAAVEKAANVAEHESARVAAIATLDSAMKTLRDITNVAQTEGFASARLDDLVEVAERTIQTARDACLSPDINVLQASTQRAVDAVNGCGEYLEFEQAKQEAERQARIQGAFAFFQKRTDPKARASTTPALASKPRPAKRVAVVGEDDISPLSPKTTGRKLPFSTPVTPKGSTPLRADDDDDDDDDGFPAPSPSAASSSAVMRPRRDSVPPNLTLPPVSVRKASRESAPPTLSLVPSPPPSPAPRASEVSGPSSSSANLCDWLEAKNLMQFKDAILDVAEHVDDLATMTDEDADEIIASCGMKKLVARRFKKSLVEIGADLTL